MNCVLNMQNNTSIFIWFLYIIQKQFIHFNLICPFDPNIIIYLNFKHHYSWFYINKFPDNVFKYNLHIAKCQLHYIIRRRFQKFYTKYWGKIHLWEAPNVFIPQKFNVNGGDQVCLPENSCSQLIYIPVFFPLYNSNL